MTFKEFVAWCNERACDGCWSFNTVRFCIEVMETVNRSHFWQKKRVWQELNKKYKIEETIVRPINEKIESLVKGN